MRILDLGEAGYEGQSEAQKHYFYIEGDYDQDRGISEKDCEEITKQLVDMGLKAHCQPDESRQGVVEINTYSGHTTIADALAKAGYEADAVGDYAGFTFHEGEANIIAENPKKFTKADFDANEDKNYHTENGVELAKAFGTPEEIEQMEQIAKNHYTRGHILSHEIDARSEIVGKYLPSLESQEEAMSKMTEGDLQPGDIELLKPMVDMKPEVLKVYARNIIKKYPHLKDNVMRMLPESQEEDFIVTYNGTQKANDADSALDILQDNGYDVERDFDGTFKVSYEGVQKADNIYDVLDLLRDEGYEVQIAERKLSKGEEDKKEDIVKGMKKDKDGFKERYGKDAEAVMYATATKLAKEENIVEDDEQALARQLMRKDGIDPDKVSDGGVFSKYREKAKKQLSEDFMDDRKYQSLEELRDKLVDIEKHIKRLGVMDGATEWEGKHLTGTADIHDQLTTMYKDIAGLQGAVGRALKIVPAEQNPSTKEFKKKYGMGEADSMGMNKYGLAAAKKNGKFISYRNGKKTGEFDSMEELSKHQLDLIKDESVEVKEGVNDVDKIHQLTDELYRELVDFQNEEFDENIEELIGHLAEFKAKLEGDTGSFSEDTIKEAYINNTKDAIDILGRLRGKGKQLERGQQEYKGNLPNEYVNDVWDVWTWMESKLGGGAEANDPKLKAIMQEVFWLRGEAKKMERNYSPDLERSEDHMGAAGFGNMVVNTLYPLMQWLDMNDSKLNEFDIKKSFNNIANNVKNTMSNVVKGNPLRTKMNKNANKNGPSLARQINWGGKYESKDDINELDTFAPKTDYIKGPGGEFYKIEYRNNSGLTGKRKDDTARFVSVNPASDQEVSALNLDDMIAKGNTSIHQGHDHQGGLPWSDKDIAVYAYGGDDYEEGIPNNAKMKLIKVMTTEAEKKRKAELGTKIRSWRETKADMKKKIEASKPGDKK